MKSTFVWAGYNFTDEELLAWLKQALRVKKGKRPYNLKAGRHARKYPKRHKHENGIFNTTNAVRRKWNDDNNRIKSLMGDR